MNTFDEVVKRYENTKPIASKWGKENDIRPLGKRNKTHQPKRIVKINDNCFVLTDGYHFGDSVFPSWITRSEKLEMTADDLISQSPIVWRREGSRETITVRNADRFTTNHRHAFLRAYLPYYIQLPRELCRNGWHFLRYRTDRAPGLCLENVFFPLATGVPQTVADWAKTSTHYYVKQNRGAFHVNSGKTNTVFERVDDVVWKLVSAKPPTPVKRVDRSAKAPYEAALKEFREWSLIMLPLVQVDSQNWKLRAQTHQTTGVALREYHEAVDPEGGYSVFPSAKTVRALLLDENAPRVEFAHRVLLSECNNDLEYFQRNFTRIMNRLCGWDVVMEIPNE